MEELDYNKIAKELKIDAKAVGIPSGAADVFIKKALNSTKKRFKSKTIITDNDLRRALTKELKKYNHDLAYVYENRDTIF